MENNLLTKEITDILAILPVSLYPETDSVLEDAVDPERERLTESAFVTATKLMQCDKPADLPPYVIGLVTDLFLDAIGEGDDNAMNDLGAQYYDGSRGFEQSFEKAMYYYQMAAEHGNRQAQENLGYCYYYGRDTEVDYEKAYHYFAMGAFNGWPVSLYKIGDMYLNGYYVQKNEREAFDIYEHCIETLTEESEPYVAGPVFLRLGKMFLEGKGTKKDAKSALICYQKAEAFLYDMVRNGEVMYKKSLKGAVEGQNRAREALQQELPEKTWLDGKKD